MKFYLLFPFLFISLSVNCQDSLQKETAMQKKKPLLLTVAAGYTASNVHGSMADHDQYWNDQAHLGKLKMKNSGGFIISGSVQKYVLQNIYVKSGLSFVQQQVDPEANTFNVYKDHLSTGWLSIPIALGFSLLPLEKKSLNLSAEFGASAGTRLTDNSRSGPDRVGFNTAATSFNLCPGAALSYSTNTNLNIALHYTFLYGLSNAYTESLYYGPLDPSHALYYKWRTSIFSLGLSWGL